VLGVEVFLLVKDVLDLAKQGVVQVSWVFGKGQKQSGSLVQIKISVYILFIELFYHQLLQFRAADTAMS